MLLLLLPCLLFSLLYVSHCKKSSFFVQKLNFDFRGKIVELFWVKTRENAAVLVFSAVDNFDFTRKIVKKKFGRKTRANVVDLGFLDVGNFDCTSKDVNTYWG